MTNKLMMVFKLNIIDLMLGMMTSLLAFIDGVLASGFGAATYYFYRYHMSNENGDHKRFSLLTLTMFVFLGFFVGYITKSSIESYMMMNWKDAEYVRFLSTIIDPATAIAGFLFMPILGFLEKIPTNGFLKKILVIVNGDRK